MRLLIFLLLISLFGNQSIASESDSLAQLYKQEDNDSLKARICIELGTYYENRRINEALKWGDRAIYHARKFDNKLFLVKVLNFTSTFYNRKGDYQHQVQLCMEALKIAEQNDFFEQQGTISGNLGSAYIRLEDKDQAIHWLIHSIELKEKYSTEDKLAVSISNLGAYYFDLGLYEAAAEQHNLSLEIRRKLGETDKIAVNLANLAVCYMMLNQFEEAEVNLNEAYRIRKAAENNYGLNKLMLDFSWLYEMKGDFVKSLAYADSAYQMSRQFEFRDFQHDAALQLGTVYNEIGNTGKGYYYLLEAYNLWIELHNELATQNLNDLRMQYKTDQMEGENLLLRKDGEIKDLKILQNNERISSQRVVITSVVGLLGALTILIILMNKWNRDRRKQNQLLNEQKKLVEQKNEEILDSIQYAKRIQAAILPQQATRKELLSDSFVLYRPKDVVAGDFYWLEKKQDVILFAVADCTGHGVPGAMVSVVCNNGLNRSVREHGLTEPGLILDKTREIVIEEFEKSEDDVKDGMDIALCSITGNQLKYAGAHNPLWMIREGEVIEYKADKQPIGKFDDLKPYTSHNIALKEGDTIYLFTDGFADQFGGPDDKKFKSVNFKKLLLSLQELSMEDQCRKIEEAFDSWKGSRDQIDDVCVLGVRIKT